MEISWPGFTVSTTLWSNDSTGNTWPLHPITRLAKGEGRGEVIPKG